MFELTYLWYVQVEEARLMRGIYAAVVAVIVLPWRCRRGCRRAGRAREAGA
jgi:hypothetical protein